MRGMIIGFSTLAIAALPTMAIADGDGAITGAAGGAVAGAVVGGPLGAAVGGVAGGVIGGAAFGTWTRDGGRRPRPSPRGSLQHPKHYEIGRCRQQRYPSDDKLPRLRVQPTIPNSSRNLARLRTLFTVLR